MKGLGSYYIAFLLAAVAALLMLIVVKNFYTLNSALEALMINGALWIMPLSIWNFINGIKSQFKKEG